MSKPHSHRHIEKDRLKTSRTAQQTVPQHTGNLIANSTAKSKRMVSEVEPLPAILIAAVCIAVLAVHWPALSAKAFSFDDNVYLIDNMLVQNPSWYSAKKFLTEVLEPSTVGGYYQPLAMISLMLDYALGGGEKNLMPFHRTSLILHIANTALIIVLLYLLFGQIWVAAGVGLLFGIHPMTVEPIPWVGERKTLLAAFFSLWSLILYVYPRVTSHKSRVTKFYIGSFVMYLLALMSKPTSTPLPAVMLLLDYWPLRRLSWRAVLEKVPFFVFGGISAIITVISQTRTGGSTMPTQFGPMRILLVLCHNIIFYLYKIIWPVNLSSHYPFPKPLNLSQPMVLAGVIGTFTLFILLAFSLRRTRAALTGWLIFFVAIFPTMQIIGFSNVIASDKFAYLPSIGLLMVLAVFLVWLCTIRFPAHCRIVAAIILLLACAEAAATRRYLAHWRNMITLCEYMLKLAPNAASVHEMLGVELAADGRIDEAINQYNETLLRDPNDADALYNLGNTFRDKGKLDQAVRCYEQGLQVELAELRRAHQSQHKIIPGALNHLYNNLGNILEKQGKLNEAIQNYREAVKFKPDFARGYYNLGNALLSKGQPDEAADCYLKAVQIKPDFIEAHNNLGNILRSQHKFEEAVKHYRQVLKYDPFSPLVHCNIGVALGALGKYNEAVGHLYEALRLKPNSPDIHYNLATVLQSYQNLNEALIHYREALKLRPDWLLPLNDIAWILANHPDPAARNPAEAVTLAERADKLTEHKNAVILNTLAAAYFAAGQTDKAVTAAQTALQLARDSKNDKLAAQILERLESYKKAKP